MDKYGRTILDNPSMQLAVAHCVDQLQYAGEVTCRDVVTVHDLHDCDCVPISVPVGRSMWRLVSVQRQGAFGLSACYRKVV
jgi:hypothetical protein